MARCVRAALGIVEDLRRLVIAVGVALVPPPDPGEVFARLVQRARREGDRHALLVVKAEARDDVATVEVQRGVVVEGHRAQQRQDLLLDRTREDAADLGIGPREVPDRGRPRGELGKFRPLLVIGLERVVSRKGRPAGARVDIPRKNFRYPNPRSRHPSRRA